MAGSRAPLNPVPKAAPRVRVLVVEDDAALRDSLIAALRSRGFSVVGAASAPEALWALSKTPIDVTLSDLHIGGPGGRDLIRRLRAGSPETPLVILTAPENVAAAAACLRDGASDVVLKPAEAPALEMAFRRALEGRALRRELRYLRATVAAHAPRVSGDTPAWRRALAAADSLAGTERAVFLCGQTAAAREHLARRIHEHSSRASGPFVRVDGTTLRAETWERELFGYRKDAFDGAAEDTEGYLQLAHGGTVMLDELGSLPASARARIRRLAEEGRFERPGDVQATHANARIIVGGSVEPPGMSQVVRIDIPPPAPEPADLHPAPAPVPAPRVADPAERGSLRLRESLHRAERELLEEALRRAGGVHREAAHLLGIDPRNLPYFLRKYDLIPPR
jgi:two-component system, NtrC family, response regulator AtoC